MRLVFLNCNEFKTRRELSDKNVTSFVKFKRVQLRAEGNWAIRMRLVLLNSIEFNSRRELGDKNMTGFVKFKRV